MNRIVLCKTDVDHVNIFINGGRILIDNNQFKKYSIPSTGKEDIFDFEQDKDYLTLIGVENSFLFIQIHKGVNRGNNGHILYSNKELPLKFYYIPMHQVISIQ